MGGRVRAVAAPQPGVYQRPAKPLTPKIALVGFCEGTRNLAPYNDPEFTIVGLNRGYIFMPRIDIFFEMHGPDVYRWEIRRPAGHIQWMKEFKGPIYQHVADPEIPNSIAYPLQEVTEDIGVNCFRLMKDATVQPMSKDPYLSSSIAYQVALAIHEGYGEIHMYGIDLNTDSEYAWQKPGVEFLLGIAAARGIKVVIPDDCALLKGKLYGRGFLKPEGEAITKSQYEVRLASVRKQREQNAIQANQLIGARNELNFCVQQMPPGLDAEKLSERMRTMNQQLEQALADANRLAGSEREILYWVSMTAEGQPGDQAIAQLEAAPVAPELAEPVPETVAA